MKLIQPVTLIVPGLIISTSACDPDFSYLMANGAGFSAYVDGFNQWETGASYFGSVKIINQAFNYERTCDDSERWYYNILQIP
jgi:hypothetical protein